jgi:4-amino-4-deoxy-L-arabinose transferase-like glycosyltransferase
MSVFLFSRRTHRFLILLLVMAGLTLRAYHYGRDRAVWHDEAGLLLTATTRSYSDLFLGRLDYHQAAPPLYLWALKTSGLLLGDGSFALRLPSFLASCAALALFAFAAWRILTSSAAVWATLWFAVSEQLLWHASEAKVYSIDVLAAVALLAIPSFRGLASTRSQLLAFAILSPLLLLSSYPASFLFAGLLLAYLPVVFKRREATTWLAYTALAASTGAVLLWLVKVPIHAQHDAEIHSCWVAMMPNWDKPSTLPLWFLAAPFEVCRYSCKPLGQILAFFIVPGALVLWRGGEQTRIRFIAASILLALAAACCHLYPFGGARIMAYAGPSILLVAAAGVPIVLGWLWSRSRMACVVPVALLLVPAAAALMLTVYTWTEVGIPEAVAYVQEQRRKEDLIVGNDVTHQYYFRLLGSGFHLLDESPVPAPKSNRLWVVMTASLPQAEREHMAAQFVPPGWHLSLQRDFSFTTVVLFSR